MELGGECARHRSSVALSLATLLQTHTPALLRRVPASNNRRPTCTMAALAATISALEQPKSSTMRWRCRGVSQTASPRPQRSFRRSKTIVACWSTVCCLALWWGRGRGGWQVSTVGVVVLPGSSTSGGVEGPMRHDGVRASVAERCLARKGQASGQAARPPEGRWPLGGWWPRARPTVRSRSSP